MKPSDIGLELYDLVLSNSHDFSPHYEKYEPQFINWYSKYNGSKNDVRFDLGSKEGLEQIKLSLLLSDFTSVFPYHEDAFLYTFDPNAKGRKIFGSKKYLDEISQSLPNGQLYAGYGCVSEELLEHTFDELLPLIEAGRLLIRPEKIIFVADIHNGGSCSVYPADSNGDASEWRILNNDIPQISYPVFDSKSSISQHHQLAEILVPYINGIEIEEFSKIIVDEEDLLSSFRVQMKSYLEIIGKGEKTSQEFKSDVIQPKLDLINRKFKTITNNHRLKVAGATLGSAGLFLISLSQAGMVAALSQFISFGMGTVGFVRSEAEYKDQINQLKDIPEYLLWRINKK